MPYVNAARKMGLEVLVASEGKHSVVSVYANGLHVDFSDMDATLALVITEADKKPFSGVVATDDVSTELAVRISTALGLPCNSVDSVQLARRKDRAREKLRQEGSRVPAFCKLDIYAPLEQQVDNGLFPAVLKPLALSASRGVMRVDSMDELVQAAERLRQLLLKEKQLDTDERRFALLEKFIPGAEVAVEAMLLKGELQILTIFDKPEPLNGPFFEESYYITPSRLAPSQVQSVLLELQSACAAYGLSEGPIHAECRINDEGVWIIEVAARTIGGLCGRLLRFGTGSTLEELVLMHATGRKPLLERERESAGVLMIPIPQAGVFKRVEGLMEAMKVPGIEDIDIQIREGHELVPLPEGASYLGFIFARGSGQGFVEAALRQAHARLRFIIAPMWHIDRADSIGGPEKQQGDEHAVSR